MPDFRIEPGLPPYGPPAISFPDPRAYSEGLIVSFGASDGERWTGNFASGGGSLNLVRDELGPKATIVVSGSRAYLVDTDDRLASEISWPVEYIEYVPHPGLIVVGNGLWFEGIRASGRIWRTRRISWDGMRSLRLDGEKIIGEAYTPMGPPDWVPFELSLTSGGVEGGSYSGPP